MPGFSEAGSALRDFRVAELVGKGFTPCPPCPGAGGSD